MRLLGMVLAPIAALAGLAACGDDGPVTPTTCTGDILDCLRALPEVVSAEELPTDWSSSGYRYFQIEFDQPVDHDHPDGPHFHQEATLIHTGTDRPLVLLHTGYDNYYGDIPGRLTWLLHANQLVVEHRFFGTSRPTDGPGDWLDLDIAQAAADDHEISVAMHGIYGAAWLETGASKGGMTSIYHRRFYPDDVDATVAYVAPISFAAPDYRYEPHMETIGEPVCRQAVRDLQAELLRNRRAMLEQKAADQATAQGIAYTRVALQPAVESAVVSLEWAFWQYKGVADCAAVPAVTATDAAVWAFLDDVSPVSGSSDDGVAEFEAYYYQAAQQLGYPGTMDQQLDGLVVYPDSAYDGAYPAGVTIPGFTPDAMDDIDAWVKSQGERILLIYGEYDPWSGGMMDLGDARDSLRVIAPMGPHGSGIKELTAADRATVLAMLTRWSGVDADPSRVFGLGFEPPEPMRRLPPALVRARFLRAHAVSTRP